MHLDSAGFVTQGGFHPHLKVLGQKESSIRVLPIKYNKRKIEKFSSVALSFINFSHSQLFFFFETVSKVQ